MAKDGIADGRPMVVVTVCDFDPAGYQMPVSIRCPISVTEGPLAGHDGVVAALVSELRIKALIVLFARSTSVELDYRQVRLSAKI
jgi:hypothetical protein